MLTLPIAIGTDKKRFPLKKTLVSLLIGSIFFFACRKDSFVFPVQACLSQTDNPATRIYSDESVVAVSYFEKHCGLLPLSRKNYWVYEDSIFDNGSFVQVQFDTLRFAQTFQSLSDKLIWWQTDINIGLPERLYANDSTLFLMEKRMFSQDNVWDVKKEYSLFTGDSIRYLTSFDDNAAMGRSVKMEDPIITPAGKFSDCVLFEKNARNFRKDQVYFKPGLGVIKYIEEKAPMGYPFTKLQQISTLVCFHLE